MNSGLNLALTRIDESIVALMRERERLANAISNEAAATSSSSPFLVPFAVGVKQRVEAFRPILPGLWFGFGDDDAPEIFVTQQPVADDLLSPPDHHFLFSFDIGNAERTPWITLEKTLPNFSSEQMGRITISLKAMASIATSMRFELSVPRIDQEDHRLPLGAVSLPARFEASILSETIDLTTIPDIDPRGQPKLIAFLPSHADRTISMAYFMTLVSPR